MADDMELQAAHLNIMFSPKYAVPIFGYAVPPLALVVLVTTFLMVRILLKRQMRSPANTVLVCIAISDTITITLPVIPFVYFYTLGHYKDNVPFAWCRVFFNLVHVFPLLSNMASLWSTVVFAFMRCFSVWRPLHAKSTITPFRTYISIAVIYVLSILVYVPAIFEYTYIPLTTPSLMKPNSTILSCHMQKSQAHLSQTFCFVHTWIQIIFTSLLPWFLITFPDMGLMYKLKQREYERKALSNETAAINKGSKETQLVAEYKKAKSTGRKRTTWMIFLVVSMIWVVEIPFAVSFTLYLSHTDGDVMRNYLGNSVVFAFLLKYVTYPVVFLIYCFMSQNFRKRFKEIAFCTSEVGGSSQTTRKSNSSSKHTSSTKTVKSTSNSEC